MQNVKISLEAARVNAGLRQSEVADRLRVTRQTVQSWERGRTEPTISQFREICGIYGVSMDCVFLPEKSNLV